MLETKTLSLTILKQKHFKNQVKTKTSVVLKRKLDRYFTYYFFICQKDINHYHGKNTRLKMKSWKLFVDIQN